MSTDATTPTDPMPEPRAAEPVEDLAGRFPGFARYAWLVTLAGTVLLAAGCFLSWAYVGNILGDLSIDFYPGALQILMLVVALLSVVFLLLDRGTMAGLGAWVGSARALRALGIGAFGYMTLVVILIAAQAGGLINVNPGGWVSFVGSLVMAVGALFLTPRETKDQLRATMPDWVEILVIVVLLAFVLFGSAYALGIPDGGTFFLFLGFVATLIWAFVGAGFFTWLTLVAQKHRRVLMLGAFMVAFLFPFTQNGSDANMSIATQVLIFATTALGLNIVVGLAGLLDLGYIAFLGAGAYTAATMSYSSFATIGWKPPFIVVMLIGAARVGDPRPHHRLADPAGVRRLPRHRHPRLRRDLPAGDEQPRRDQRAGPHPRAQRHTGHPRPRDRLVQLRREPCRLRDRARPVRELLLRHARRRRGHHHHLQPAQRQPDRSRLGRHPRGRAGRRGDGRQRLRPQAVRLRQWRLPCRDGRDDQGASGRVGDTRAVHLPRVGVPARRRRPRRHGHGRRRPHRRDDPQAPPREAAVRRRLPADDLRGDARPHDAIPPGGHRREQTSKARVP